MDDNSDGGALYEEAMESDTYHRGRKAGRLAALREVREMVAQYIGTELTPQSVCEFIDALIRKEGGT